MLVKLRANKYLQPASGKYGNVFTLVCRSTGGGGLHSNSFLCTDPTIHGFHAGFMGNDQVGFSYAVTSCFIPDSKEPERLSELNMAQYGATSV